jgi:hypothetical protein
MSYIRCLYIEVQDDNDSKDLDHLLNVNEFPFYDATDNEPMIVDNETLEEIEAEYKGKFHHWLLTQWGILPENADQVKMIIEFEKTNGQVINEHES